MALDTKWSKPSMGTSPGISIFSPTKLIKLGRKSSVCSASRSATNKGRTARSAKAKSTIWARFVTDVAPGSQFRVTKGEWHWQGWNGTRENVRQRAEKNQWRKKKGHQRCTVVLFQCEGFQGTFQSSWPTHIDDYNENCRHSDVSDDATVILFMYLWAHDWDACQCYESLISTAKQNRAPLKWKQLVEVFAARFSLITKQTEILNRLEVLKLGDVRNEGDGEYAAIDKLKNGSTSYPQWLDQRIATINLKRGY